MLAGVRPASANPDKAGKVRGDHATGTSRPGNGDVEMKVTYLFCYVPGSCMTREIH